MLVILRVNQVCSCATWARKLHTLLVYLVCVRSILEIEMKTKQAYAYQAPPASRSFLMNKIEEIFGLDLRSLALFRFALGCMVVMDLMDRWPDMRVRNIIFKDQFLHAVCLA
jgi:hypothetical protein